VRYTFGMKLDDFSLANDPRWQRLRERPWRCPSCAEEHCGLFDLACGKPDAWPGPAWEFEPNSIAQTSTNFLSEDFCVLNNEHFFVRCVLQLPILGALNGETFGFGVWSTLSRQNFALYLESFDEGLQDRAAGPWFGWFSNALKGYPDSFNLKCQIHPVRNRQRPWIELENTHHPLAIEQRDGISFDRVLDLLALNGHDIRAALTG
jgi:hypothetical protein